MEEKETKQNKEDITHVYNWTDSMTNVLTLGMLTLQSPHESMDDLIIKVGKMLKNKDIVNYLDLIKNNSKKAGTYVG